MRTFSTWIRMLDFLVVNLATIYLLNYWMEVQMDQMKMKYESTEDTFDFIIGSLKTVKINLHTIFINSV